MNGTDRQRLADWLVGQVGDPYDLAHARAVGRWLLNPAAADEGARRQALHLLDLVQAFLFMGHPMAMSETRYVVPRDFESAIGFEWVQAAPA